MDSKSGNRQRRQERIRRIMEQNQTLSPPSVRTGAVLNRQPPVSPPQPAENVHYRSSPAAGRQDGTERDPELMWKSQANPWENAGWRLAPQSGHVMGAEAGNREDGPDPEGGSFILRGLFIQTALAGAIFMIVFAMFRTDLPLAKKGQAVVTAALTDEIDFTRAESWYDRLFAGAPSFIPMFGESDKAKTVGGAAVLPVVTPLPGGSVVKPFAQTLGGVQLAGKSAQPVLAAETGRVLQVTDDKLTGRTVTVQHAGERVTVYGELGSVKVAAGDWIEAGAPIGVLTDVKAGENSLLFFAVKEKGRYVDPADVVPFD